MVNSLSNFLLISNIENHKIELPGSMIITIFL